MQQPAEAFRLFIAIQLPAEVRAMLGSVQSELRQSLSRSAASWTRPENLHLTLRFLGDITSTRVGDLVSSLKTALVGFGPLELNCRGLGCFPNAHRPRVVWAATNETQNRLALIHQRVSHATDSFTTLPAEKEFTGHVTIARPKLIGRADAAKLAEFLHAKANSEFGHWSCSEIELIRSELSDEGSRYTTLARFAL